MNNNIEAMRPKARSAKNTGCERRVDKRIDAKLMAQYNADHVGVKNHPAQKLRGFKPVHVLAMMVCPGDNHPCEQCSAVGCTDGTMAVIAQ